MKAIQNAGFLFILIAFISINAQAESRTLNLKTFTGFELNASYDVVLKQGNEQSVRIEGTKKVIDNINTTVKNGVWKIESKLKSKKWAKSNYKNKNKTIVYITIPKLTAIGLSGSGNVNSSKFKGLNNVKIAISGSGNLNIGIRASGHINTAISGSGNIKINGQAKSINASVSGSGNISGKEMKVKDAKAQISGSGNVYLHVEHSLMAKTSGSGDVRYKGKPTVKKITNGSGKVSSNN